MRLRLLVGIAVGWLCAGSAQASPIIYSFSGTVSSSTATGIAVGDVFSGTLSYDAATMTFGYWYGTNGSCFFGSTPPNYTSVSLGGETYQSLSASACAYDDYTNAYPPFDVRDSISTGGMLASSSLFTYNAALNLSFYDLDRTIFSGGAPSALPYTLDGYFDLIQFGIVGFGQTNWGDPREVRGTLTSFSPEQQPVPEPASVILFGTGIAVWRGWRKLASPKGLP